MGIEQLVRQYLYYPLAIGRDAPIPSYIKGAREVWCTSEPGDEIHGLYWPAPPGRPTFLFFHGNAQSVYEWGLINEEFAPAECGLLLIDFPGYGKSSGTPSEEGLYAAGHAALSWLTETEKIDERSIVIFGKSLGGGVATEIALGRNIGGVILESTFRSISSVLSNLLPVIPPGTQLTGQNYDSISRIDKIDAPILVIHGIEDELIPLAEGQALYDRAKQPKELYLVKGATHNDVSLVAGLQYGITLRKWLDENVT
jgi:uncharacterized protein